MSSHSFRRVLFRSHEGKLSSLRHLKDDVKEMAAGYECGMSLEGHNDIKEGDIVECFIMEEIPR